MGKKFLEYLQAAGVVPARKGNTVVFKRGNREVSGKALSTVAREYLAAQKVDSRQRAINFLIKNAVDSVPIADLPAPE